MIRSQATLQATSPQAPHTPIRTPIHPPFPPPPPLQLITVLRLRLSRYRTTIEEDEAIIADPAYGPRPTVAARLLKAEKRILQASGWGACWGV